MRLRRLVGMLTVCTLWLTLSVSAFAMKENEDPLEKKADTTPPGVTAYISGGYLTITGIDESGIAAFYVNGYEYTDFTDASISFRLQKFDATVQYFKIRAKDTAGNLSNVYKLLNPYYDDNPDDLDDKGVSTLPADSSITDAAHSTATVLSHAKTDVAGNFVTGTVVGYGEEVVDGRDFYTIEATSGKTFYLVIDRLNGDETVYFLTEVSENDLLHLTDADGQVLTMNSLYLDAGATGSDIGSQSNAVLSEEGAVPIRTAEQMRFSPDYKLLAVLGGIGVVVVIGYFVIKRKSSDDYEEEHPASKKEKEKDDRAEAVYVEVAETIDDEEDE